MIGLLVALAVTVLFVGPAVPPAMRMAKDQRAAAAAKREAERQRHEQEAEEAKREHERVWREEPGNAVLRERLLYEAQVQVPLDQTAGEAQVQLGQLDGAIQRHEAGFHHGAGGRPGLAYQIVVLTLLGLAVAVFVLGAILDYLIFRGLHPGGSVLIPAGLSGVVIIAVMVGSFLAISAQRHGLIPAHWSEYFRIFARLFGVLLAVGAVTCMTYYAPARSYLADEPKIVTDQATVAQLKTAVAPDAATAQANAAALNAAETTLANDQATLHKAQLLDRVSAGVLGALEIPLTEAAILGAELIAFRVLLRRREQARQDRQEAVDQVAHADARFTAQTNATLIGFGHDHRAYAEGLARLRELSYFLKLHANGGHAPGGGPAGASGLGAAAPPDTPGNPGTPANPGATGTPGGPGAGAAPGYAPRGTGGGTPVHPVPSAAPLGSNAGGHVPGPAGGPAQTGSHIVPVTVGSQQSGPGAANGTGTTGTAPLPPSVPLPSIVPTGPAPSGGPVTRLPANEFDETE
jgi:hypothetical protein